MLTRGIIARLACGALCGLYAMPVAAGTARELLPVVFSSSYADSVLRYDPGYSGGCVPTNPNFMNPQAVLGVADYSGGASGTGAVALGSGGLIEVRLSPIMANSGDDRADLRILEVGGFDEACFVALRPAPPLTAQDMLQLGLQDANQDGFFEIKRIGGGSSYLNVDAAFSMRMPAQSVHFDAVQIVDDTDDHSACTTTSGADIDMVEALDPLVAVAPGTWTQVKFLYRD
jgi:hypothetical protein